jgi:hypothetical protein
MGETSKHEEAVRLSIGERGMERAFGDMSRGIGSYWASYWATEVRVFAICVNHPPDELLAMQSYVGPEDFEWGSPMMVLADALWDAASNGNNCGSSSGQTAHVIYAYHLAMFIAERTEDAEKRKMLDELKSIETRRQELVAALSPATPDPKEER